jgi:ankyrin repeat protein
MLRSDEPRLGAAYRITPNVIDLAGATLWREPGKQSFYHIFPFTPKIQSHDQGCGMVDAFQEQFLQAAEQQDFGSLKKLLDEYGADSLTPATKGTALLVACSRGHLEVVQYMLDTVGADIEATDTNGVTYLVLARRKQHHKVARYLKFVMALKSTSACPSTSSIAAFKEQFFLSLVEGDLDSVRKTIQQHGNIVAEINNNIGLKALHVACVEGHLHIVEYLVSKAGVNVETTTNGLRNNALHCTALHCAAYCGHVELVRYLVETLGANVEATNASGNTTLHCACDGGHLEIVQYLVAIAGANVQASNALGDTPLHAACVGYLQIVQYLVATAGADVEAANMDGRTPLHLASARGCLVIWQSGKRLMCLGVVDVMQYLVSVAHANVEATTKDGNTALHLTRELSTMRYLVEKGGADVGATNNHGQTPLHTARSLQMVRYLVERTDVDLLATDVRGLTRLDMSKAFSPNRKVAGYLQRFVHIHAASA